MDGVGQCSRHSAYVGHPDADNYSKHLLTLLAQRRELQTEDIRRLLSDVFSTSATSAAAAATATSTAASASAGSAAAAVASAAPPVPAAAPQLPPSLFSGSASATSIERERRELHVELSLGLESRSRPTMAEACRAAVEGAGKPLSGLNEAVALTWHFRARQAEAVVEQRAMLRHTAALRRQHFGHVVGQSLPAEVHRLPPYRRQLDHAGSAWQGSLRPCGCEKELALAKDCMQALQLAEADAAARLGRLTSLRCPDESDWWAAFHWAACRLPAGRAAERFFDRLRLLPLSHHHRFPIYEQVSGAALRRDQHAATSGLRVPPQVVTTNAESVQHLEQLFREFDPGELLPQASSASSESIPMTVATDNSARHHKAAYEARRILPRVLARHRRRWPGASVLAAALTHQQEGGGGSGGGGSNAASPHGETMTANGSVAADPLPEVVEPFSDDPACTSRDQVHVVRVMDEQLAALVPSLDGDESAGYQAVLRTLPLEVDEVLKAENDFLNDCNEALVHDRMRSLAEQHVDRWSPFATEEQSVRMTLSLANAPWVSQRLQDKTMEALFVMRFLATKRNKIKVLHYMNAIVSLQLQLLRDEREEEPIAQPFPTTAAKDFTCPVAYANGTAGSAGGSSSGGGGGGGSTSGGASGPAGSGSGGGSAAAADAEYDVWMDDPEAGVSVRDANGKWILYGFAVDQFKTLELEILRVASYHLEVYAAQVHAGSSNSIGGSSGGGGGGATRGSPSPPPGSAPSAMDTIQMVDKFTVLADLWECEAQYCAARHKALLAYYHAYRHATCWGLPDIWGGCSTEITPFTATATGGAAGAAAAVPSSISGGAAGVDAAAGPWQRVAANSPQPQLLGARRQLRRELVDLAFRRPNLAQEDGYFVERYHSETLSMELEATLVGQLCGLVARHERQNLAGAYMSAGAAVSAAMLLNGGFTATTATPTAESLWKPGYNPGIVYGGVLAVGQRGLLQEGATLSAVGAAAAALPAHIRAACSSLAGLHQLRHHVELADLRRAILQYGVTEMAVLLREEAYRAHAPVERPPKDSMFDSTRGRRDLPPDTALLRGNWLVASHVADNVEVLRSTALEVGTEPRAALEVFLNKEALIRSLYRGEVLWLVYVVQARALGRRVQHSELHGIDWGQIDAAGNALKAEMLAEVMQMTEPDDIGPPGASGPGDQDDDLVTGAVRRAPAGGGGGGGWRRGRGGISGRSSSSGDGDGDGGVRQLSESEAALNEQDPEYDDDGNDDNDAAAKVTAETAAAEAAAPRSFMVAVGTRGLLGGVWRSPPLALAEFSTSPAELLNPHSLAGLRAMMRPGDLAYGCLAAAVRAQALRAVALEVSIRHNQVLLDGIIRKLDRRRRVLMWRAAALEGVADGEAMDVVVGGPPGAYAPAHHPMSPPPDGAKSKRGDGAGGGGGSSAAEEAERRASLPPLMRDPPGDRLEEYNKQRRSSNAARAWMRHITQSPQSPSSPPNQYQPHSNNRPQQQSAPQPHALLEALDAAGMEDLRLRRRALTAAAGSLYFDINEIKLRLRVQARRSYVQGLLRAKGNGGGPEAEMAVRSETETHYTAAFLAELLPAASRTHMAAAVRELAVLVLGGTGGYGRNWGLHYDADGQLLSPKEDRGPLFQGVEGQVALRAAVLEYGPLWQGLMFQLADKKNDPDPMDWAPASPAVGLPYAIGFVQLPSSMGSRAASPAPGATSAVAGATAAAAAAAGGAASAAANNSVLVRLESLWGLPGQWEVLHGAAVHYPPGPTGLSSLEKGVMVASLVVEVVRHFLFQASLLAPSTTLAVGGDVSGQTAGLAALTRAGVPQASAVSYNARSASGAELYQQAEMRMTATASSLLPGALLAPDLVKLQARLQYLHRPPGARPSSGGPALQPSATQPVDDVILALRREVGVLALQRVLATARVRDSYLTAGTTKKGAWFLTSVLEHLLARTASRIVSPAEEAAIGPAAPPPPALPLPAAFALRLPDPDRLALHNEAGRLALALERWLAECRVPAATAPHDALALQEYCLAGMWAHDRLRDALSWRALLMEAPDSFPFSPPHVAAFLRRYHCPAAPLCPCLCPPKPTVEVLQALYGSKVLGQAKALVAAAETYVVARATARSAGAVDEDGPPGAAGGEGKPAWLTNSPAWGSPEARFLEACTVVCKQHLDLQAVQVALLRLHQDCAQLAGLRSLVVGNPTITATATATGTGTSANGGFGSASADMLHPHALPAAAVTVFARKLAARQRRGGPTGDVVEINMDDLLKWLADAMSQLTASARLGMAAAAAASQRERAALHGLVDGLEEAVEGLAADHDTFMRRHEIKVETQVVDRAMSLLLELSQARRCALRNAEDARRAMDTAFTAAQKQYGSHIDELNNQLIVARTNSSIMRSELQKSALEALIEVRREMLNRAFASGTMKMTDEVGRMLALERQLEEQQTEILDLQCSITKVQSWFKMRSSTFLTACMKEVAAARGRTETLEAELWEVRERNEITVDQLTTQLRATQADLEAVSAGAARNASDLKHALASNKKLIKWKVTTAPRIEALKMKMAQITRNREAWQEWVNSKQGLMQHLGSQLLAAHRQQQQLLTGTIGPSGQGPPQRGTSGGTGGGSSASSGRLGGSGTLLAADSELEVIRQQWDLERRQMQQEIARLKTDLSNERLVKNDVFERLLKLEQQYAAVAQVPVGTSADGLAAVANGAGGGGNDGGGGGGGGGGRGPSSNFLFGRSTLSPVQADILSRRYEELKSSHHVVKEENAALRRTLAALKTVAPDLVQSLEFPLMQLAGSGAPAAMPVVAAHGAAAVPDLRGTAVTGLPTPQAEPAEPAAAVVAPPPPLAGSIRPGTAGRLRPLDKGPGGRLSVSSGGSGNASPAAAGGGSSGGGLARRGVGASGARPPSAATYSLRAIIGPNLNAMQRPRSARPWAGTSAAAAAPVAAPAAAAVPVATATADGSPVPGASGSPRTVSPRQAIAPLELNASRMIGTPGRPVSGRRS